MALSNDSSALGDSGGKASQASLKPVSALVVPLPRRPLFPGYLTTAYLKNQSSLAESLRVTGDQTLAAFMMKDVADYRGCILRPGLQGEDLLERLHPIGTLAKIAYLKHGENGLVILLGLCRVRMTGCVVGKEPLTVMVHRLEEEEDVPLSFVEVNQFLEELSGQSIIDPNGKVGWYFTNIWKGNMSPLADFGPAVMPVLDKRLHQRALEELKKSRRLALTVGFLKQELEMDTMTRQMHLDEVGFFSEEEKALLTELSRPEPTSLEPVYLEVTGDLLIAPSVLVRVRMNTFRNEIPPDTLQSVRNDLKQLRFDEHKKGY